MVLVNLSRARWAAWRVFTATRENLRAWRWAATSSSPWGTTNTLRVFTCSSRSVTSWPSGMLHGSFPTRKSQTPDFKHFETVCSDFNFENVCKNLSPQCFKDLFVCMASIHSCVIRWASQEIGFQQIFFFPTGFVRKRRRTLVVAAKEMRFDVILLFSVSVTLNVICSLTNLVRARERPASRKTPSTPSTMKRWRWWFAPELSDTSWLTSSLLACPK